jgi:hypothetical protein
MTDWLVINTMVYDILRNVMRKYESFSFVQNILLQKH